jgi:hypothetical protein
VIARLWTAWLALLARQESGTVLAAIRMGLGLCVVLTVASVLWADATDLWVSSAHGGVLTLRGAPLIALLGGPSPTVVLGVALATMLAGVALTVGLGGRITAFITLQLFLATVDGNSDAGGAYDELLANGLWLLVLGDSTATWSVDARRRTGRWQSGASVSAWPRYLAAYQLVLMYGSTGLQKVSTHWLPGGDHAALYYILQQPTWRRFDSGWVAGLFELTQVATAVTWWFEVTAPIWLVGVLWTATRPSGRAWSTVRWGYALVGLALHLGVTIVLDVGPFSCVTLVFYLAMVHPPELQRLLRRLGSVDDHQGLGLGGGHKAGVQGG